MNGRITIAGIALHYLEQGQGEPLLLLHGYGANVANWRFLIPALAHHHRVIALDLKGFGASDKPGDSDYGLHDQATLVDHFIDALGLCSPTLIGHSMGGGIALLTALRRQQRTANQRISRLVLIGSIAYPQRLPPFIGLLRVPLLGQLAMRLAPARPIARLVLRFAYANPRRISDDSITAYAVPIDTPGGRHALLQTARQIVPSDIDELITRYPTLIQPTLILWGDRDRIVPLENGQRLFRALPDAQLERISNCGHIPQEEQPDETLAQLNRFLYETGTTSLVNRGPAAPTSDT